MAVEPNTRLSLKAAIVSATILLLLLAVWHVATLPAAVAAAGSATPGLTAEQIEYQKLLGKDPAVNAGAKVNNGFPTLAQMRDAVVKNLSHPFYDNGPNDKGIAIQIGRAHV